MSMRHEENDIYIIPPNFIDAGTVFGRTIKLRNAAEALILSLLIGFPVFHIPATLTTKIIVACLTVLPAALFAIIGINGESLSSFVINFFVYLKNRRIVGLQEETCETPAREKTSGKSKKAKKPRPEKKVKPKKEDYAEEFGQFKERRQAKQAADEASGKHQNKKWGVSQIKQRMREEPEPELINPSASYLPIRKIENGIIYTKDHRYVKIIEVIPINFLLRSAREQRNIIYSFISYLKIIHDGDMVSGIYEDCSIRLKQVRETDRDVLRLIIPDAHNRFPEDENCMEPYRHQELEMFII